MTLMSWRKMLKAVLKMGGTIRMTYTLILSLGLLTLNSSFVVVLWVLNDPIFIAHTWFYVNFIDIVVVLALLVMGGISLCRLRRIKRQFGAYPRSVRKVYRSIVPWQIIGFIVIVTNILKTVFDKTPLQHIISYHIGKLVLAVATSVSAYVHLSRKKDVARSIRLSGVSGFSRVSSDGASPTAPANPYKKNKLKFSSMAPSSKTVDSAESKESVHCTNAALISRGSDKVPDHESDRVSDHETPVELVRSSASVHHTNTALISCGSSSGREPDHETPVEIVHGSASGMVPN
eukprot:CAMPEP_0175133820 /NCGR_PEP_ID=MMETSP0087-20121206/7848_1 /TAXON_ID=136419 /ORGANISM="Unknown Unknown, Strain D1" /LENGTH=289 /DNA_ID=CAMNT_0016416339 /DNA_START=341 /DNA_END=1210 /DNA_ORIENTATION=-